MATVAEQRAADVDRERVVERLRRAHSEGRIDVFEFDERVAAAYAARTYADLDALTADLPVGRAERDAESSRGAGARSNSWHLAGAGLAGQPPAVGGWCGSGRRSGAERWAAARRAQLAAWLAVGLLNVVIWAVVSIATGGGVYPWWIWVIGPWGVALAVEHLVARLVGALGAPRGDRDEPARSAR